MPDRKEMDLVDAVAKADDLLLISALVVRQWERDTAKEAGGKEQIERARRGAAALLGGCVTSETASPAGRQSPPSQPKAAVNPQTRRVPRPKLAKKIEDAWGTREGKTMLISLSMRQLKQHFGMASHASFYDVPLFVEKIRPLRDRIQQLRQAENWVERNARARP